MCGILLGTYCDNFRILKKSSHPAIAIVTGILAAVLAFTFLTTARSLDRRQLNYRLAGLTDKVAVVVATRNLMRGTLIGSSDVKTASAPRAFLVSGYVGRKELVVGRETVSDIFAGEAVSSKRISGRVSRRASLGIRTGRVALAVGIDEIAGVSGAVRAGDKVDIFSTDGDGGFTDLLFERVPVIGVGGVYPFSPDNAPSQGSKDLSTVTLPGTTVVLELTPDQAGKVTQASENGKLRLALRSFK